MRRVVTSLLVASLAVLVLVPSAFAGKFVTPQQADLYYVSGGSSDSVTADQAPGQVRIVDPMGSATLIINGSVQLQPSTGYSVWVRDLTGYTGSSITSYTPLGYYKLAWFMTDANGYADFQVKAFSDFLPSGTYNLQVAINADPGTDPGFIGTTVIATQKYLTVTVHS